MATYANAAGSRDYKLYIPANRTERAPLIVMLHGCTQSPDDFAAGTRMNALAEELFGDAGTGSNRRISTGVMASRR